MGFYTLRLMNKGLHGRDCGRALPLAEVAKQGWLGAKAQRLEAAPGA